MGFPPGCYCTQLPWFALQVRNAPGVAQRRVLQLANMIIIYMQNAVKRLCRSFFFLLLVKIWKPLMNTTFRRFVWGNHNSVTEVPLGGFDSWTCSALFLIPEVQIFTKVSFAQSYDTRLHIFLSLGEGRET